MPKKEQQQLPLMNEKIRDPFVQLITHEGENIGVISRAEALRKADLAGLDLVLISEGGREGEQ